MQILLLSVLIISIALNSGRAQYPEVSIRQVQEVPMDSLRILDTCTTQCPWSALRSRYAGDTVTVTGLCMVPPRILTYTQGGFTMLLYDTAAITQWRGLFVRCSADTAQHARDGFLSVRRGDVVRITGIVREFPPSEAITSTEFQPIPGIPITIVGTAQPQPAVRVGVGNFRNGGFVGGRVRYSTAEPYEGMVVEVTDVWTTSRVNASRGTFAFVDSQGNEMADFDASRFFTLGHGGLPPDSVWQIIYPLPGVRIDTLRGFILKSAGGTEVALGYRIAPVFRGDVVFHSTTFVSDAGNVPDQPYLFQNYPNPFSAKGGSLPVRQAGASGGNPSTKIAFSIPVGTGHAPSLLQVFDVLGREVATLVNENLNAGRYETTFDASGLPSGVYFYQLKVGSFVATKKMLLVR